MAETCDYCGQRILRGQMRIEGEQGVYCSRVCRYDAEVMDAGPRELPPKGPK